MIKAALPEERHRLEVGVASLIPGGESRSSRQHLVAPFAHGTLVAVFDALGRGEKAAHATSLVTTTLVKESLKEELDTPPAMLLSSLLWHCHEGLRGTPGVMLSLALFDDRRKTMTWLGVGNVWGAVFFVDPLIFPRRQDLLPRSGVVGVQVSPPFPAAMVVHPYDIVVLSTEDIRGGSLSELPRSASAKRLAEEILAQHKPGVTDAVVLVARYTEPSLPPMKEMSDVNVLDGAK